MAKTDFTCKLCKDVVSFGWLETPKRFECPTHKFICYKHITSSFFSGQKCEKCDKKVIEYRFNDKRERWEKI